MLLYAGFLILLAPILYWVLKAIFAGSTYPFALFMDERITYEPIHQALVGTWFDLLSFFFDGHDNRYGRLLWNIDFIGSYIPFKLFGDQGQIITTRLIQMIVLMTGYYLMIWSLVKSDVIRILVFLCLMLLPQSFYYFLMPKPEPFIVLIIGCLIHCLIAGKQRYYFLFLGILAGLKISTIPICGLFLGAYLLTFPTAYSLRAFWTDIKKLFNYKIVGFYLLLSAGLAFLLFYYFKIQYLEEIYLVLMKKKVLKINLYHGFVAFNAFLAAFFIMISWLYCRPSFSNLSVISRQKIQLLTGLAICNTYLYFTPFNIFLYITTPVTHGADNTAITVFHWLDFMYKDVFFAQPTLIIVFLSSMIAIWFLTWFKKTNSILNRNMIGLIVLICLVNLLPVIFFTKRLWGFYLLLPMVFLWGYYAKILDNIKHSGIKIVGCTLLLLYPILGFPGLENTAKSKIEEEREMGFVYKKAEYLKVCETLNNLTRQMPEKERTAFWDPNLFFPDQLAGINVKVFWGPFNGWKEGRSLVVLSNYPDKLYQAEKGNKNFEKNNVSITQFRNFTDSLTGSYSEYHKDSFQYYRIFLKH